MLDTIREGSKKPWVKFFIFAIVISFVFAGGFSATTLLGDPNAVAVVNGDSITRNEFQRSYANMKASRADFYKANVKTEEDEANFQENVLQQLITQKVTEQSIDQLGMRLSTQSLKNIIQSDTNYQVEGKYSAALVEQTLTRIGMSKEAFKRAYENQETARQLSSGLFQTNFSLENEVKNGYELTSQTRSGKAIKINVEQFKNTIEISDQEIEQYYAENQESFRVEEKVSVDYLELSVEKLMATQVATEEQINAYYQENIARFKTEEQRQYSHILVLTNDDKDAALAKANAISVRLSKGEDFAEIAKNESDDVPTQETGGDLGVLPLNYFEGEAPQEPVSALKVVGDITPVIKLDFGFQILKLTAIIEGNTQPLEEVKDELLPELQKQLAENQFYQLSELLKEKAFEFADSLNEAAEATGLTIQTSPLFGKSYSKGLFADQNLKNAAFSSDVKDSLLNSETLQVNDKQLVVLRLKEFKPSVIQELAQVKTKVVANLKQNKAKEMAEALTNSILSKLEAKENIDELLANNNLSWIDLDKVERNNSLLSYSANAKLFKMAAPVENAVTIEMADDYQGYTVLMLNAVDKGNWIAADKTTKEQRELYYNNYFANADYESYLANLRNNADVTRKLNNLPQQ